MATIYKRLSKRVQPETNLTEVLIRLRNGKDYDLNAKSGIFITPDNFRGGEIVVNRRKVGNDVKYHEEQKTKMDNLCKFVLQQVDITKKSDINSDWFKLMVDKFNHPEKYDPSLFEKSTFYQLTEVFLSVKKYAHQHVKNFRVMVREVARYEGFIKATENDRKDFTFDVDTVTKDDIEGFKDFITNEFELSNEYPALFKRLLAAYPAGVRKGHKMLEERGENTVIKRMQDLKTFFMWLFDTGKTMNRPFAGLEIGVEKYGTPYYITIDERNKIADTDLEKAFNDLDTKTKESFEVQLSTLEVLRDVFIFQCFVGCRVGDLMHFTDKNIISESIKGVERKVLVYTPHKTKDREKPVQARVPLHPKALAIVERYQGIDKDGRLFPLPTVATYNNAIKEIFTLSGITRNVEVRNPKTGENELHPINEIASSHLARRTFVGNAYFKVSDPNIIGKMSGHVEGSRAFSRYRKIEDSTLEDVINQIG